MILRIRTEAFYTSDALPMSTIFAFKIAPFITEITYSHCHSPSELAKYNHTRGATEPELLGEFILNQTEFGHTVGTLKLTQNFRRI